MVNEKVILHYTDVDIYQGEHLVLGKVNFLVEEGEMVYLTGNKMCLVYPDGGDFSTNGGWGEASFWHFKAK